MINEANNAALHLERTQERPSIEGGTSYFEELLSPEVDEDDLKALQQGAAPDGAKVPMGKGKESVTTTLKNVSEKKLNKIKSRQADSKTTLAFAKMAATNNDDDE